VHQRQGALNSVCTHFARVARLAAVSQHASMPLAMATRLVSKFWLSKRHPAPPVQGPGAFALGQLLAACRALTKLGHWAARAIAVASVQLP
jgi:hypothetical protein